MRLLVILVIVSSVKALCIPPCLNVSAIPVDGDKVLFSTVTSSYDTVDAKLVNADTGGDIPEFKKVSFKPDGSFNVQALTQRCNTKTTPDFVLARVVVVITTTRMDESHYITGDELVLGESQPISIRIDNDNNCPIVVTLVSGGTCIMFALFLVCHKKCHTGAVDPSLENG